MVVKLFIKDNDGKITEIEMSDAEHERCTVLQLKRRTRHRDCSQQLLFNGLNCSQLLFFNGRLLKDAAKLSDYGIKHESTIHSYTKITIFIKNERGKTFEIRLDEDEFKSCLVLDLKRRIFPLEGVPDRSQLLFFNDCLLEDAAKLSDYGIQHKSTIHSYTKITLFIKNPKSKTIEIHLNEDEFKSCLVLDLKSRIRAIEGIPDRSQLLLFNGRLLEDAAKLSDYGIQHESTIHSFVKSTKIRLFIINEHGKTFVISLDEDEFKSCLVLDLKSRIRAIEGIPESQRQLIHMNRELVEDSRTLSDYGIHDLSFIHMCLRLMGGGTAGGILDPAKEGGGMGDKGGKNRSMDNLLLF